MRKVAARVLDIALTARGEHDGAPIPMCGVPVHAAEGYLARLIKAGHRVAIAEQIESPERGARSAAGRRRWSTRAIVRVRHRGHADRGSAARRARRRTGASRSARCAGRSAIAAADISTGRIELDEMRRRRARRRAGAARRRPSWSRPEASGVRRRRRRCCARAPISTAAAAEARLKRLLRRRDARRLRPVRPRGAGGGGRAARLSRPCRARRAAACCARRARRTATRRWRSTPRRARASN